MGVKAVKEKRKGGWGGGEVVGSNRSLRVIL